MSALRTLSGTRWIVGTLTWCVLAAVLAIGWPVRGQDGGNPCPEGRYLDLSLEEPSCRPLFDPTLGFDGEAFRAAHPDDTFLLRGEQCTDAGLRAAVAQAESAGGGTIDLSACEVVRMEDRIFLPENTMVVGGGVGKTVLRPSDERLHSGASPLGELIYLRRVRNIVLRDLTIDGLAVVRLPVAVAFSRNILLERVELVRGINNGVDFTHSADVTVRYSVARGTTAFNGLSSKDCYPNYSAGRVTLEECIADRTAWAQGDFGYGGVFTTGYALYSNDLYDNNDHCIAFHARSGEVAGNRCRAVTTGFKFPDAKDIFVHHNSIEGARKWGIHSYAPTKGLAPERQVLFQNRIRDNGWFAVRIAGTQVSLLHNTYSGNMACELEDCPPGVETRLVESVRIAPEHPDGSFTPVDVRICPDTQEEEIGEEGYLPLEIVSYLETSDCMLYGLYPLELTAFEAAPDTGAVQLDWTTRRSFGGGGFAVEQAAEGEAFEVVGYVPERTGEGPHAYGLRVDGLSAGTYAYRLRLLTLTGEELLTPERSGVVEFEAEPVDTTTSTNSPPEIPATGVRIAAAFPNPFRTHLTVRLELARSQVVRLQLVDALGRVLDERAPEPVGAGNTRLRWPVDGLPAGVYWIRVVAEDGQTVRSVVKR